jgi:D-glycero-D-manno-heptose 1,7-bisphosphate phosphatase
MSRGGARRAAFLDRDGVLNRAIVRKGKAYAPLRLEDFRLYRSAPAQMRRLADQGYVLVVVTNQPDVGSGLIQREAVEAMHERLARTAPIERISVCYDAQATPRRKPAPGMLVEAAEDLGLDLETSVMIGDRWSDVAAGRTAGCRTVFIDRGYVEGLQGWTPDVAVKSLPAAVTAVIDRFG